MGTAGRHLKPSVGTSSQNLILKLVPSQQVRPPSCGCSLTPAQPAQGLTHSLEEHKREDRQQKEQEQELGHLRLGGQQDAQAGWSREQSVREGLGQIVLEPGLGCS